jgi:hypothetical protein
MRRMDCRASLAMTKVLGIVAKAWNIAMPSIPVIARREAPWQSMRRFSFLERRYNLNRLLTRMTGKPCARKARTTLPTSRHD